MERTSTKSDRESSKNDQGIILGEPSTRMTKASFWENPPERNQPTAHLNPEIARQQLETSTKKFWEKPPPEQARKSSGNTSPEPKANQQCTSTLRATK
ncbi:hypothetical protein Taro_019447 [Colocasia esculenta]|uniref:Uncharacterized protein n=1 Tax=Colocasia esculenta TaxID=4460 RepID=A0A843UL36_COLES|nr:hypothetical protein [Colocasia esculenta]